METKANHKDCHVLIGRLINHDDTDTDRSQNSKLCLLFERTLYLWEVAYQGEKYDIYGTFSRGSSSENKLPIYPFEIALETGSKVKVIERDIALQGANFNACKKLVITLYADNKKIDQQNFRIRKNELAIFFLEVEKQNRFIRCHKINTFV